MKGTQDFTVAGYPGSYQLDDEDSPRVLPFAILYLTSGMKAIFGLVSIAAAVMSSADSSMLSASTMITRNVYQTLLRPTATEKEVVIALRTMICALGSLSVYMALSVNSVFYLWTLCSDIVYVLLFPQLLCVFYFKETNAYGSVLAFIVSGVFRCLCGEPSMNVPVVVRLPLYDPKLGQRFPFRLLSMALGLATLRLGSYVAAALFRSGLLSDRYDVFHCFVKPPLMCQPRETSIASFDHATGAPGSMGSENTPGAPSGTQRISTADTASEREVSSKGVSKDNRRLWDATELPDELQHGNRLSTKKFSLASCGISSLELGGAITGTRGFLTASTASEREAITWGASRDNRSMSVAAGPTDEAQGGGGPTRRKSSLTSDRRSLVVQSGSAPTGARHVSITDLASEGEAITWGFSKKNRTQSVVAEPADEAQAGGGPIGKKSSQPAGVDRWDGVAGAVETAPLAVGVLETGEAASSIGGARAPLLRDALHVVPPLDVEPRGVVWAMGVGVLGVSAVGVGPLDVRRCWFVRNSGPARIGPGDTEAAPIGAGYAYDRASCIGWFGDAGRGVITKRGNRACICGCMGDGATGDRPLAGVRPMIGVGSWKIAGSISGCRMLRCGLVGG
ncbi:hypothetical protein HPB49_025270 [Dermacentor silvarum]|uniref:Uncharacterized protein n=1 Tax=Dermacentor silvarum TaxID=543639 RepID=A0ACB8D9A8_DERSI|nr:hypothetical protein HPB49_025270 [Dermacentor silvarum]